LWHVRYPINPRQQRQRQRQKIAQTESSALPRPLLGEDRGDLSPPIGQASQQRLLDISPGYLSWLKASDGNPSSQLVVLLAQHPHLLDWVPRYWAELRPPEELADSRARPAAPEAQSDREDRPSQGAPRTRLILRTQAGRGSAVLSGVGGWRV
jgi:hypothetical protein